MLDDNMRIIKPVYLYLKFLVAKDYSINTLRSYGTDLKLFWEFLAYKQYKYLEITPNLIGDFIEYLREPVHSDHILYLNKESCRTGKSINRILSTVYNFYKFTAMTNNIENPILMDDVSRPFGMFKGLLHHVRKNNKTKKSIFKVKESKNPFHLLSTDEMDIFLNALPTWRDRIIFKILRDSGIRIGELLSLQIEDISRPKRSEKVGLIHITDRDSDKPDQQPKSGSRNVYVPTELLVEIENYIMEKRIDIATDHNYLFVSQHPGYFGNPLTYSALYDVFKNVSEKTGIRFNFHDLRHTFCSDLIEAGTDISIVQRFAGHKYISTTQQYIHLSPKYTSEQIKDFFSNRKWSNDETE